MASPHVDQLTTALTIQTTSGTINLNDKTNYAVHAESRQDVTTSYNEIKATSPVLAGEYIVHVTPGMVSEVVKIWCYGSTQTILANNIAALRTAFESWSYQLHWTWGDYSETWNCNAVSQITWDISQGYIHNYMALVTLSVPRFPTVTSP